MSKKDELEDDFYNYINQKWIQKTKIPTTKSNWDMFDIINKQNRQYIMSIIQNSIKNPKY